MMLCAPSGLARSSIGGDIQCEWRGSCPFDACIYSCPIPLARSLPFSRGPRILEERRGRRPASICLARTSSATHRRGRMGPRRRQQRFCSLVRPLSRDAGRHGRAHHHEPYQQLRLAAQRRRAPLRRGRASKPPFTWHLDGQRRVRQQLRFGQLLPSSGHPHAMARVRARPRPLSGPHALPASLAP